MSVKKSTRPSDGSRIRVNDLKAALENVDEDGVIVIAIPNDSCNDKTYLKVTEVLVFEPVASYDRTGKKVLGTEVTLYANPPVYG